MDKQRKIFCPAEAIFKGVDQHGQMSEAEVSGRFCGVEAGPGQGHQTY